MKEFGVGFYMGIMEMDFSYDQYDQEMGDVYVCLLEDSLVGDFIFFICFDVVDESWIYFDKILDYWKKYFEIFFYGYFVGIWGLKEVDVLINCSYFEWINLCKNLIYFNLYCKL